MRTLRVKPNFKRSNVVFAVFYGASLRIRTVAVMIKWSAEWVRDQEVLGSIPFTKPFFRWTNHSKNYSESKRIEKKYKLGYVALTRFNKQNLEQKLPLLNNNSLTYFKTPQKPRLAAGNSHFIAICNLIVLPPQSIEHWMLKKILSCRRL